MSDKPSQRIKAHMNSTHQMALIDYLVVYGKVKESILVKDSVAISEIDEEKMLITYKIKETDSTQKLTLVWRNVHEADNVEVKGYGDLREKLISMAKYAASKRGYSHRKIDEISWPSYAIPVYVIFVLWTLRLYDKGRLTALLTSHPALRNLWSKIPADLLSSRMFSDNFSKTLYFGLYSVHLCETFFITLPRVTFYRVPFLKKLVWMFMNFIEGFFVLNRFNALVKQKE
ncbi:Piso0_005430 [Millerozyma farinosa CBS 7064]|uniref:Piso0_005430 protein n=1 Tax=Pichia sorbitophila (strain ATCC MYA-4447 / BCRC 22081 / CBS 7064 / NBRC 10061 / NRRL Y-12695) TaxID=559304 RepID=G8XZ01_PICSO|nr:Piso0_005430 [Millerozyma farinosa CBS 7064]